MCVRSGLFLELLSGRCCRELGTQVLYYWENVGCIAGHHVCGMRREEAARVGSACMVGDLHARFQWPGGASQCLVQREASLALLHRALADASWRPLHLINELALAVVRCGVHIRLRP